MSTVALTKGAVGHLHDENVPCELPMILQVLQVKFLPKLTRWSLRLSDGETSINLVSATQLASSCEDGTIVDNCVVKVTEFTRTQGRPMILSVDVLEKPEAVIGNPVLIKKETSAKPATTIKEESSPVKQDSGAIKEESSPVKQENADAMQVDKKPDLGSPTPKGPALTSPAPSPPKAEAGSPITMSQNAGNVMPIDQLNPYNSCKIKGRVVTKEEVRTFKAKNGGGEKKVFSIVIMDDTCDLKVTFWDDMATKYHDALEVGKSYTFTTNAGSVKMGDRFNPAKCAYVLTLNARSVIEQCQDNDAPKLQYRFVTIDQLENYIKKNSVDVIGILQEVSPISEITLKSGSDAGKNKNKRNVSLVDTSGKQVSLTLWDELANHVQESDGARHAVIAVRSVRVGDYNGCSLSTGRMSVLELDPELEEAKALQQWYASDSKTTTFQSVGGGSGGGGAMGPAPRKFMSDIEGQELGKSSAKGDVFSVCGYVTWLNNEKNWQYPSNPETKRKVTQEGDQWRDEKSQELLDTCVRRYILPAKISDHTGSSFVTVFDEDAKKVFGGVSADEMWEMSHVNEDKFKGSWKTALFQQVTLKVRAKTETYNDEQRVKVSSIALEPVDYRAESQQLLDRIRRYNVN